MKRFFKILAVIALMAYLVVSVILWSGNDKKVVCERFYITVCDSTECDLVTAEEIYNHLAEAALLPQGKPCSEIDLRAIEACVSRIDILTDIECYYERNGDVHLYVSQRRPFMRVMPDEGEDYYIDVAGNRLAAHTMYVDYVPLVTGNVDDKISAVQLMPLVDYISRHELWCNQVTQIDVTDDDEILLHPRVGDHVILLGDMSNYERKMNSVLALYRQAIPEVGWNAYDTISVKYKDQIVCTRRDKKYRHNTWTKKSLFTYE